jgi:hypothetical protein
MQIEFLLNGGVSLILAPENQMEEELLKGLMKQQNDITEFRSSIVVLNKTFRNGIVVGKKPSGPQPMTEPSPEENLGNDKA